MTASTTFSQTEDAAWFQRKVSEFANELAHTIDQVLDTDGSVRLDAAETDRAVIELVDPNQNRQGPVVNVGGQPAARVLVRFGVRPDSARQYLAVTKSDLALTSTQDRSPLFRLEYRDDMQNAPSAHWQVHAERGALSHILARGGKAAALSALHLPVGGSRLRPCVEDFLQFMIDECGIDGRHGWMTAIEAGRERWRRRQIATAVRDVPDEAVRVLRDLGYLVEEPAGGPAMVRSRSLTAW